MNNYITGATIKRLREKNTLTQLELGDRIGVSDKTISKWETSRGLPDITLIEPLAKALGISVTELMTGEYVTNANKSSNMLRSRFYVCPVCGNVLHTMGEAVISCCGIALPALEAENADDLHRICIEVTDGEYFVTLDHEMTREHHISFIAYVTSDRLCLTKLYPEGEAQARFPVCGQGAVYAYCNRHGLVKLPVGRKAT